MRTESIKLPLRVTCNNSKIDKMQLFLLTLLAVSAATAEKFCSPNSVFKQNCNLCTCSADGEKAACTDMACPEDVTSTMNAVQTQIFCEPGKRFRIDNCSTCTCSTDGTKAMCTLGLCLNNRKRIAARENKFCAPEKPFSPDNCNICECSNDGTTAFCTLMMCPQDKNEKKQVCTPRASFKDYCNTCACADDGLSFACTRMWCDKEIWNQDGSLKVRDKSEGSEELAPSKICAPKSSFKDYCNFCACTDDGMSYACTRMWCSKDLWNKDGTLKVRTKGNKVSAPRQVCTPLTSFKDYCNHCFCAVDGMTYACSRMWCDKDIWNKDGTQKAISIQVKKVCTPGKVYSPDGCNTCICNGDGTEYACTYKHCLTNLKQVSEVHEEEEK